jgi:hypothetical protein
VKNPSPENQSPEDFSSKEFLASDLWSGRAWLARLSFSCFIAAFILAWQWRSVQLHPVITVILVVALVALGFKGVQSRHG